MRSGRESGRGTQDATPSERPVKRTQDWEWALKLAAARQYRAREGHLNIPRKHVEALPVGLAGPGASGREIAPEDTVLVDLGMWAAYVRRRADKLPDERRAALDELRMRWRRARRGI
ncbi:helicase associated domain-containing protein [Streptomyces kunmingensis]|uniref:Helicase associated domain-containing protein n=1 Tax=Streptomyces kunmingensis TaxID=68225 RepID=A0ABU6C1T8_9ACTN|nr:helicase associated domain-containing protein [Streptomyces kunmingensis]MEB3958675.1 helicase associated domain-containing protein [Streptomyces kunmingensis]